MVARRALAEDLADSLLDDILDGTYPPNSVLPSEVDLAEISGMSRLTVREAIKSLCSKRVLRVEHGRGTFVSPLESWSVLDPVLLVARSSIGGNPLQLETKFLEARRVVEIAVAGMAEANHTAVHLEKMRSALERMRALEPIAADHVELFVEADIAFHQAIMEAADNPFLEALFEPMSEILFLTRHQTSAFAEIREHAIVSHQLIYDAFLSGVKGAVTSAMTDHLRETESDLKAHVRDPGGSLMSLRRKRSVDRPRKKVRDEPARMPRSLTWSVEDNG